MTETDKHHEQNEKLNKTESQSRQTRPQAAVCSLCSRVCSRRSQQVVGGGGQQSSAHRHKHVGGAPPPPPPPPPLIIHLLLPPPLLTPATSSSLLTLLERLQLLLKLLLLFLLSCFLLRLLHLADFLLLVSAGVVTLNITLSRQRAQELLLDPLAGTSKLHLVLTFLLTHTWMTHLLTAMTTAQLFRTLVVAGAQLHLCLFIS